MPVNYFTGVRSAIQRGVCKSVSGKDSRIRNQVDFLIGEGMVFLGHSRLVHSVPSGIFIDLHALVQPVTVAAAQANSHIANQTKNFSVRVFSHAISIPSVSGPSFQVCGDHVDCLLSKPSQSTFIKSDTTPVDVCGPKSAPAACSISNSTSLLAQPGVAAYHSFSFYKRRSYDNCRTASMCLKNNEQPKNNFLLHGYFMNNAAKRRDYTNPFSASKSEDLHSSSTSCSIAGTARDLSLDNSPREEQQPGSADTSKSTTVDRTLKLNSGSCYLPHPDKEETGGEDAHFICSDEQAIGVADGVGGWADVGVDAGEYARELMSNSVSSIQEEPRGSIDPARVLSKAYSITKAKGSSTACIIALTDQGLHTINLGDSGFLVVREGSTVFRSHVQQHDFNFTYQLECGNDADLPSSGQVSTVTVAPGDVIICGTDGLFDNLYNSDMTAVAVHAVRAGFGPQVTAEKIAALARQRALDSDRQTPFSTAAQEAGFRYHGGKLDDITVVVSYVVSEHNESQSAKLMLLISERVRSSLWFSPSCPAFRGVADLVLRLNAQPGELCCI